MLSKSTVGVVGLGLIGGSIALALKRRVRRLIGVDPSAKTRRVAVRRKAVHAAAGDVKKLSGCDLVIVAAPQLKIAAVCAKVAKCLRPGATILEVGSVKNTIARGMRRIPDHVNLVSGHPMAGTEHSGMENAFAELFRKRPFVLIPTRVRDRSALRLSREVVRRIGAREVWMLGADEHDAAGARLIHLPHVIAYSLVSIDADSSLAGPSYRSATRVAHSSPRMVAEMLYANRGELRKVLPKFNRAMRSLERALGSPRRLEKVLARLKRRL